MKKMKIRLNRNYDEKSWVFIALPVFALGHYPEGWQIALSWMLWEVELKIIKIKKQ